MTSSSEPPYDKGRPLLLLTQSIQCIHRRPQRQARTTAGPKKKQRRSSRGKSSSSQQLQTPSSTDSSKEEEAAPLPAGHSPAAASSVIAPEEESSSPQRQQQGQQQGQQGDSMERGGRGRSLALLLLVSCLSLLAALEYQSGGKATQGLWSCWTGLGGGDGAASEGWDVLMITGGGAKGGEAGPGNALVVHPEAAAQQRRGGKKRAALANAGKAVFKVLGLPIKTVLGGLRKLFSLAKGGRRKGGGGLGSQGVIGQHPHRPVTYVDLDALGEEERGMVEATYQDLLGRPGVIERALAVGMVIDRECVARYYIAEKWKKDGKHGPSMADNIARTVRWREDERVSVLGPGDVARQAWNGYLYVNGTDKMGRPLIYYRPADQSAKRPEEAIRYLVYTLERALAAGRKNGGVEAYSFIIDCGGFSLANMPPVHLIKQAFQLLHHHYPTRVGFICMLYTGSAFQLLWKVLNPLVSPMTRNKILFAPSGQEAAQLLARIDPDQLETRFGGESGFVFDPPAYFGLSAEEARRLAPAPGAA